MYVFLCTKKNTAVGRIHGLKAIVYFLTIKISLRKRYIEIDIQKSIQILKLGYIEYFLKIMIFLAVKYKYLLQKENI